jgi:hypothetical protein
VVYMVVSTRSTLRASARRGGCRVLGFSPSPLPRCRRCGGGCCLRRVVILVPSTSMSQPPYEQLHVGVGRMHPSSPPWLRRRSLPPRSLSPHSGVVVPSHIPISPSSSCTCTLYPPCEQLVAAVVGGCWLVSYAGGIGARTGLSSCFPILMLVFAAPCW